jgi:Zn-dependent protease with chaperone function
MAAPKLRNPAEIPLYVASVVINLAIVAGIIYSAWVLWWLPEELQDTAWAATARVGLAGLLLLIPGLVLWRELTRASTRGSTVQLSRAQFPEIYATMERFAQELQLRREPEIYLTSGNGALNAFAASAFGYDFVVINSELFADLYQDNQDGLAFIIGHELGHIKLGHTSLWYQLSIAFIDRIPLLGAFLSRAREYSCDRHGAHLSPHGEEGLLLLTAGRYVHNQVNTGELLTQAAQFRGFWAVVAQLPSSHPFTVNRVKALYQLKLFTDLRPARPAGTTLAPVDAASTS